MGIINSHFLRASSEKWCPNQDIKRGGNPAAMQHYHNEPLMLKISAATKVLEMIHSWILSRLEVLRIYIYICIYIYT